ncbi:hypothetical protein HYX09_00165 [Candidatus Woesearchaeota archaeon]|nr:hypothetical protein [Candidatus Woesearchaeota archaeon]
MCRGAGLKNLSEFKENLIKGIFSCIDGIAGAEYIFIVGSFLTEKVNYNDIDIVLVGSARSEEYAYNMLTDKFNLKFHIISVQKKKLEDLLRICPLSRAMLSKFICNRDFKIPEETAVDKKHIQFLLMMPQDMLEIRLGSRAFFDNIRRLVTIEKFLKDKNPDIKEINDDLKRLIEPNLYEQIRNNGEIDDNAILILRKIIKAKLKSIMELLENGKK